jgi:tetratricopeptide (TPR) repeat protein
LALILAERGEFDEGNTIGQEAIHLAEAADHPFSLALACWGLAYLYDRRGEFDAAVRLLEQGLALSREWNLTVLSPRLTGFLGSAYARSQRVVEGLPLLHQALKEMEALGIGGYHSLLVVDLGEACFLADRLDEAHAAASRALSLARSRGERGHEAWALRLLGDIAARREPAGVDEAETYYRDACTLANELGMRPLMAHCHFGLGKLYRCMADGAKGQEHLAAAVLMYREMDMGFWLAQAEGALREPGPRAGR